MQVLVAVSLDKARDCHTYLRGSYRTVLVEREALWKKERKGLVDIRKQEDDLAQREENPPLLVHIILECRIFRKLDYLLHIQLYWVPNRHHIECIP